MRSMLVLLYRVSLPSRSTRSALPVSLPRALPTIPLSQNRVLRLERGLLRARPTLRDAGLRHKADPGALSACVRFGKEAGPMGVYGESLITQGNHDSLFSGFTLLATHLNAWSANISSAHYRESDR